MSFQDVAAKVVGGFAGAAGNTNAQQEVGDFQQRREDEKQNKIRMQVAPLSLALQGYKARFSDAADPNDPSKAAPGKEAEYNAAHDGMAAVIGKIRALISPPPKEDPHGLSLLEHQLTDKLHITRHAVDEAKKAQKGKVDAYNQQTTDATNATVQGNIPFALTTEGRKEAAAAHLQELRNQGSASKGNATRPVPYYAGAVNKGQAVDLSKAGKVFKDADGEEIDISKIPDGMFLLPVFAGGGKEYYELGTDKGRYETGDNRRKYEPAVGGPNPNAPDVGAARVPTQRSSSSIDQFGVKTTSSSTSTPVAPGQAGKSAAPVTGPKTKQLQQEVRARTGSQLDENGHIPEGDEKNSMLRTAANQLLDGMDINKLNVPQKDKQAVAQLAQKYGWEQGKYTPRELTQFKVATAFLKQFHEAGSLKVLDSIVSREKLRHAMDPKGGFIADVAGKSLTPDEAEFQRFYNSAVGTIQGLTSITRSGRATEAAVNRLKAELPNILQSSGSDDARKRLEQLFKELNLAVEKDSGGKSVGRSTAGWKPPADAPPAPKEDDHKLKDGDKVIAVSRGGQWVQP